MARSLDVVLKCQQCGKSVNDAWLQLQLTKGVTDVLTVATWCITFIAKRGTKVRTASSTTIH